MVKNNLAIIQARLGSTRFKRKILKKIGNKTLIEFLHERVTSSKKIDKIVIATTTNKIDDELCKILQKKKH